MDSLLLYYFYIMYKIYLASASARRREILRDLGYNFTTHKPKVDESFIPEESIISNIKRISLLKAQTVFEEKQDDGALVISGDTIVRLDDQILGKPADIAEAKSMLRALSNRSHEVISAFTIYTADKHVTQIETTTVFFKYLTQGEIDFYIERYKPLDKAGSYGIQEWIGQIGITHIEGDYYNVMGLPAHQLYTRLMGDFGVQPY